MTAIIASSARMIRAPLQAAARRQYSAAASSASNASAPGSTQVVGHSNQRLAIALAVSAIAGVDVTYAYFTYFKITTMTAIIASSARMIRAPLQAAVRRQYSAAASSASSTSTIATQVIGHSNQRLAIASAVSAIAGVDVTYAYFTYFKKDSSA
ncbi:hypothetical protein BGX26_002392 [Mortierella sp. AD094]|nr:hypothetical protein BGX26_002392 [Mortierella sp. AD094]